MVAWEQSADLRFSRFDCRFRAFFRRVIDPVGDQRFDRVLHSLVFV